MTLLREIYLMEVTEPVDPTLQLEDQLEILEQRLGAAKRGLGFSNKLKNPAQKKKHMALVLTNLNKIRANLTKVIAQLADQNNEHMSGPGNEDQGDMQDAMSRRYSMDDTPAPRDRPARNGSYL